MSTVCLSLNRNTNKIGASFSLKGKVTVSHCSTTRARSVSQIKALNAIDIFRSSKFNIISKAKAFSNISMNLKELNDSAECNIKLSPTIQSNSFVRLKGGHPVTKLLKAAKFSCDLVDINKVNNFYATEKLYPNQDLVISKNNSFFINRSLNTSSLYDSINDGIAIGNYTKHGASGYIISNDEDYIQPSSVFTKGSFRYKCQVSTPNSDINDSILCLRASAPLSDRSSNIPPQYKISNIKLEDPSGSLIAKYKDITVRGDGHFSTYFSAPTINNGQKDKWDTSYPTFASISGYTLNLDFDIDCLDDPFSEGFSVGYEETCDPKFVYVSGNNNDYLAQDGSPLSTQTQGFTLNPNNSIKISAIELSCSGGQGFQTAHLLPFYSNVQEVGIRKIRKIYPLEFVKSTDDINVFPEVNSVWKTTFASTNNNVYNSSGDGAAYLISKLQTSLLYDFITLDGNTSLVDSGRLTLKFSHQPPESTASYTAGAFAFGGPSQDFDTAELQILSETDSFFTVDSVELKVIAKKAQGSNNYFLDVVGYSDDGLLNITSRKNAFLQNDNSIRSHLVTNIPDVSGFLPVDDLGIATVAMSNKNQYFKNPEITNPAGDHYIITDHPSISSTTFQEYTIPLKIYPDNVVLGKGTDYSISSFFENLYLDIYPIPSGASIATAYLSVTYKPSNALVMHTVGQQQEVELTQRNVILNPSSSANTKLISNSGTSVITNIPQAYSSSVGSHSNYTKRWRGIDGNVVWGPFDPNMFSSDFYNPPANHLFTYGYYKFNENVFVTNQGLINENIPILIKSEKLPHYASSSGLIDLYCYGSQSGKSPIKSNGFRFQESSLFSQNTGNRTIDWSRVPSSSQVLANKITDSFEAFLKTPNATLTTSPENSGILFKYKDGFAIYMRFSPDENVIGSNYNLFSSGLLFSIVANNTYPLSVGYSGGKLTVVARDEYQNTILVQDSKNYDSYSYPLPLLITYNDNNSRKIKIYTDSEIDDTFNILRGNSSSFNINLQPSSIVNFSAPTGDTTFGPRINKFITEIGLSDSDRYGANIVENSPNKLYKQTTASSFFDGLRSQNNNRYKLFDFVNDDVETWKLGEYNYGHFSADFHRMTKRGDSKYIVHKLNFGEGNFNTTALAYSNITSLPLPSSLNLSGICYHTQIENDSLRFSLSEVDDNFVAIAPRINKNLPRGYNFREDSLVVDTIIEHETYNDIKWSDGKVGPKLLVSLYTTAKDDSNRPSEKNLGLINRSIHYIKPSGNIYKISSTFNYKDLFDRSETWADFPYDYIISEFDHNLFNYDINNMFLQYDLVYPSGPYLNSTIKIYSANVRLEKAFHKKKSSDNNLMLTASGDASVINNLNLHTMGLDDIYVGCNLYANGSPTPKTNESLPIYSQSSYFENINLNIFTLNIGRISSFQTNFFDSVDGIYEDTIPPMYIYTAGRFPQFDDQILPLYVKINESHPNTQENVSLFTRNKTLESLANSVNISVRGTSATDRYPTEVIRLFVTGDKSLEETDNNFNLYINSASEYINTNATIGLYTINYPAFNQQVDQQGVIIWDSNNVGKSITSLDNSQAFLDANDEIRGVDLICYGACNDE